ncbi:hypothetical protein [Paludisphaera soli]|uniref:hypothetical protein n=1 Tax=Paludisphaera soli TaxID=2712865 RepID=UPI0013EBDA3E|nr:hypothetical protein [Paludisphaera soli]
MNSSRGLPYRTAYDHARAIVDASKYRMGGNVWATEDVPTEVAPMIAAIARKMRAEGEPALMRLIRMAVDDVLEGRQPRH